MKPVQFVFEDSSPMPIGGLDNTPWRYLEYLETEGHTIEEMAQNAHLHVSDGRGGDGYELNFDDLPEDDQESFKVMFAEKLRLRIVS